MRRKEKSAGRVQSGSIHVYFRGNHLNNVFYSDDEKYEFLKICNLFAKKHDTKIQEFVIMDNHVHLQVYTFQLSEFMRRFLQHYSRWYNLKHKTIGKLFISPFNSACKYTPDWQIDSRLYILQNPIKAGICKTPSEYKWSSFHFHFNYKNELRNIIDVDTSLVDDYFCTKKQFESAIIQKCISLNELNENGIADKYLQNRWMGATIADISNFIIKNVPKEHSIFSLPPDDLRRLVADIRVRYKCSISLISKLLHINYRTLLEILNQPSAP